MPHFRQPKLTGFTLVEVMMAATFLVVGFIGMIEAVALSTTMMDHGRRQAYASQIINNEIEKLRLSSWTTVSTLPTSSTSLAIDRIFWPTWKSTARYAINSVVTSSSGAWYRCIVANTNQATTNTTYWTSVTTGLITDIVADSNATYTLTRSLSSDPVTNVKEVNFTVTWVVTTSRRTGGSILTFTYSLSNSAWFGKYGLNLNYQRS